MNRTLGLILFLGVAVMNLIVLPPLYRTASDLRGQSEALSTRPGTLEKRNTNAFARILGELRIGAADFLFVKTELYLHGGIGYAPHTDNLDESVGSLDGVTPHEEEDRDDHAGHARDVQEREAAHDREHALATVRDRRPHADPHEGHEHAAGEGVQMQMRSAEEDFRGIVGHLEREIKPWRDPDAPHVLTGGAELLPWFRLMTITNPHFVRGYRIGAMWLGRENKYEEALEFLDEGIASNPDNPELFRLYLSRVLTLTHLAREQGEQLYRQALEDTQTGLELGYRVRPPRGETGKIHEGLLWNRDLEEDLLFLTRFEVNLLDRLGRTEEALKAVRRHRGAFPDDGILQRLEQNLEAGLSRGNGPA